MTLTRDPSGRRASNRRGFVDSPSSPTDHALAKTEQVVVIAKANVGRLNFAVDLDEAFGGAVNHDVGDIVARQQRFERPKPNMSSQTSSTKYFSSSVDSGNCCA